MPGELIDYGAKALKPVENYVGNYLNLWDNLDNPNVVEAWHAMNTWVTRHRAHGRRCLPPADQRVLQREPADERARCQSAASAWISSKLRANLLNVIAERRPHHAALPVGRRDDEGRQHRQGALSGQWRPHRDHGRQRRREAHLAADRHLAGYTLRSDTFSHWQFESKDFCQGPFGSLREKRRRRPAAGERCVSRNPKNRKASYLAERAFTASKISVVRGSGAISRFARKLRTQRS